MVYETKLHGELIEEKTERQLLKAKSGILVTLLVMKIYLNQRPFDIQIHLKRIALWGSIRLIKKELSRRSVYV